jgi:hypothetical protein
MYRTNVLPPTRGSKSKLSNQADYSPCKLSCTVCSSILKMEVVRFSEMPMNFYHIIRLPFQKIVLFIVTTMRSSKITITKTIATIRSRRMRWAEHVEREKHKCRYYSDERRIRNDHDAYKSCFPTCSVHVLLHDQTRY